MGKLLILIICLSFLIFAGAQEPSVDTGIPPQVEQEEEGTHLHVVVLDGMNDKLFELDNCKVLVQGKLRLVNDNFNYTKTFLEGDIYEITISIRKKI